MLGEIVAIPVYMTTHGIADKNNLVGMTVKEMEQKLIGQTLKHVNDNRTYAAKMLGISIRTLRNKLKEYLELEDSMGQSTKGK